MWVGTPRKESTVNEETLKKEPVFKTRIGLIKASVWLNDTFYSVTIVRSYKDGNDWHDTSTFGHDDLLNVARVAERCETWIASK